MKLKQNTEKWNKDKDAYGLLHTYIVAIDSISAIDGRVQRSWSAALPVKSPFCDLNSIYLQIHHSYR